MASLAQPKFNVHSLFFCFATRIIDGVEWDDIMAKIPNTLVEVGCKEEAQINANGIKKEPQPIIEAFVADFHQDSQIVDKSEPNTFSMVPPIPKSGLQESQTLKWAIKHDYVVSKKRKKGTCVNPGAIALAKYAHQKGKTISTWSTPIKDQQQKRT